MEKHIERSQWFDSKCRVMNEEKNQAYHKMQTRRTRANVENYRIMRREERQILRRKKREFIREQYKNIEKLNKEHKYRRFYREVNLNKRDYTPQEPKCA